MLITSFIFLSNSLLFPSKVAALWVIRRTSETWKCHINIERLFSFVMLGHFNVVKNLNKQLTEKSESNVYLPVFVLEI